MAIVGMIFGGDVARGIDVRIGAAECGVDRDAARGKVQTRRISERDVRYGADSDQYRRRPVGC